MTGTRALQEELRPLLLRRMKEDVETLPDKEEIIIWVELTTYQREYYKALFEQNIASLLSTTNKNLPNLRNLAMELRKLCCHPVRTRGPPCLHVQLRTAPLQAVAPQSSPLVWRAASLLWIARAPAVTLTVVRTVRSSALTQQPCSSCAMA